MMMASTRSSQPSTSMRHSRVTRRKAMKSWMISQPLTAAISKIATTAAVPV